MIYSEYVDPVKDIGALLLGVEKPGRYSGGEFGRLATKDATLQMLIAFPDLYEIGMSNQALRIIYNRLNSIPGISCDRAFAPAPDFERLLRDQGFPLYGLDTGISLKRLDLLLFTLGYELGISGILAMLDVSGIPLRKEQRSEDDPLIIVGGPAVSNPLPYSAFIDAFWIGEAEAGFFDLVTELLEIKRSCVNRAAGRTAMLERIRDHPSIWMHGKDKAVRAVDFKWGSRNKGIGDRGSGIRERSSKVDTASMSYSDSTNKNPQSPFVFPIASMKTVQHHGILEIMRGCPNGCRFCHAGYWYRPMRQKSQEDLVHEAEAFINLGGYREISLSSLSSGDYSGIDDLTGILNERFSGKHVSFQLPSLRVSTFSLSLLEKISQTRRSGLTFAVETPLDFWQLAINKQVTQESVVEILREAKRNGWRGAKFYFMIGLPVPEIQGEENKISEEQEIVNFVSVVGKKIAMHFNVNVGIFVPKPHTPYQWAQQIDSETALAKLDYIRSRLKPLGHKVSVSDPLISQLEGIFSRGDERATVLIETAFRAGSRLDAWHEFIAKDVWRDLLSKNANLTEQFLAARDIDTQLPWKNIVSGVTSVYLQKELEKSNKGELSPLCITDCITHCGVCGKNIGIKCNADKPPGIKQVPSFAPATVTKADPVVWRLLFSFSKEGSAVFHGHLSLIEIFSMSINRAGIEVLYTQGFNPLAKLEIVSPLSVGISASAEIAAIDLLAEINPEEFVKKINLSLVEGIMVNKAQTYRIAAGHKKHSLSSLLWGFGYRDKDGGTEYIPAKEEKAYRTKCLADGGSVFSLRRASVLARNVVNNDSEQTWASYFEVYGYLYNNGSRNIPN
jgi:radical SAM family uncharacterized protein